MEDTETLAARVSRVRAYAGREARVERLRAAGRGTVREYLASLLDEGSFVEIGTLAHSDGSEDAESTPGDGKVGGHGTIAGRAVTVVGDDVTVRRGSTSVVANAKVHRLFDQALRAGNPFIYLGQTGGARIPDSLGSVGHTRLDPMAYMSRRTRQIPLVTAIVGESFGGSSLVSALSDLVVQLRGSCLAVTSPLVIAEATGERISFEDLGGVDAHASTTGQIDLAADTFDDVAAQIAHYLSFLPQNGWTSPPRTPGDDGPPAPDPAFGDIVPSNPRVAYDMHDVINRLVDGGDFLELRPDVGQGVLTGLARIDGFSVGIVASQPVQMAGSMTPRGVDKVVRLLCTCDAFDLPVLFLQDTPGFLVGTQPEREGLLHKAMLLHQAIALATVPLLTVYIRKSFGLATACLAGMGMGTDTVWAWPGAQIGFMDPNVGARVLFRKELDELPEGARRDLVVRRAAELAEDNSPYGAAGIMRIDEVIEPSETRVVVARRLGELSSRRWVPPEDRPLRTWPTSW